MRTLTLTIAALLALLAPADARAQSGMSQGGVSSENVEWLDHHEDTLGVAEGGRLVGSTFFMTNNNQGLFSYDVSKPESPRKLDHLVLAHAAENEDVATNGRILLLSQLGDVYHLSDGVARQGHWLNVIDVRDPANMTVIAKVDGGGDHTWDCVLDCTWAYSATGQILDLRDPTAPKLLEERWRDALDPEVSPGFAHDVSEVAPGLIMVATTPMLLLDARENPAKPKVIATAPEDSANAHHNIVWPRAMRDRFIVTASESQHLGRCETYTSARLQIWDATGWERTRTWQPMGSYKPVNGTYTDGQPPVSGTWYGCSAHWAETHPYWQDGGIVAGAFYSHGARLLGVGPDGEPKELGYFMAHGAGASAVYWITDRILYVADDTRGLDVIRYTGPLPPPPTEAPLVAPPRRKAPLVDRRAPRVKVRVVRRTRSRVRVAIRCSEDCFGRVGRRSFSLRRGVTKRYTVRRTRTLRVVVHDRAGNYRTVKVRSR